MALRHALLALASVVAVAAACSRKDDGGDVFCAGPHSYVNAPSNDCGRGITSLDVRAPCAVECIDPGYAECPGPCIVWRISAPQPTTCRFTAHFTNAPDFSDDAVFKAVTEIDPCNDKLVGGTYDLPGVASRGTDASVETGVMTNDAALEASVTDAGDASSDAD